MEGKSKLYVLFPDGTKDYIDQAIVDKYEICIGRHTVMGYPIIKED
jgi:hypothetical protein